MPRTARLDLPDLLQHVIVRGVNHCDIFLDDHDRRRFLDRFSALLIATHTDCFAWALLPNHLHLLLRPRKSNLAHLMRRLLTGYAVYFNRRHSRSGHLFQNRYKSIVCDGDAYLLELVRYIHLNPLRSGLVSDMAALDHHPWSGHAALIGQGVLPGQIIDELLSFFAANKGEARRRYQEFVVDAIAMGRRDELVGRRSEAQDLHCRSSADKRILGGDEFCRTLEGYGTLARQLESPLSIAELVRRVCQHYAVAAESILARTRLAAIVEARSVICYLAVRELGHSGVKVGEHVGIGRAGVSHAVARGERIVASDRSLLQLIDK